MSASRPSRRIPALGPRGEGWVALQVALLVLVALAGALGPRWPSSVRTAFSVATMLLAAGGLALVLGGFRRLGDQLTPYPRPAVRGTLKEDGVYGLVRHPIYGGVLMLVAGWALVTSPLAVAPGALLVGLFEAKHRREELWLSERFAGYGDYRARVPRRFIPFLW